MGSTQCSVIENSRGKCNSGCKYIFKSSSLSNAGWLFESCVLMSLSYEAEHTLSALTRQLYQLKHTCTATFEISPPIPISPITETWHLVTRQKIVFKTPHRKNFSTWQRGEGGWGKAQIRFLRLTKATSQRKYAWMMRDVITRCLINERQTGSLFCAWCFYFHSSDSGLL